MSCSSSYNTNTLAEKLKKLGFYEGTVKTRSPLLGYDDVNDLLKPLLAESRGFWLSLLVTCGEGLGYTQILEVKGMSGVEPSYSLNNDTISSEQAYDVLNGGTFKLYRLFADMGTYAVKVVLTGVSIDEDEPV